MLSRNRLIQRLRSACSRRRLFSGERGAIAASLIEIGVAMLAVGILTAGAVTSFTGFIDSASDSTARGRLTDAASTADQTYNWLRPAGKRCYSDTKCTNTDVATVAALQEAAGGQITFATWPTGVAPDLDTAGIIYVQVTATYTADNKSGTLATGTHNGIAGDPADGQWIRLAIKSDSGATFCVIKVAHTADPIFEGAGYMSVHSDASETTNTAAHCGGHGGDTTDPEHVTSASCVYGSAGTSTASNATTSRSISDMKTTAAVSATGELCATDRALGRPGGGFNGGPAITGGPVAGARTS